MKKWMLATAVALLSVGAFAQDPDTGAGAKAVVEEQAQIITQNLQANASLYNNDQQAFQSFIKNNIAPRLDFDKMSEIALGKHLREVNAAGKFNEFRDEFSKLLIRVYSNSWQNYTNAKVRVLGIPEVDQYNRANVRAQVTSNDGKTNNLTFSLYYTNGEWKFYDATFENVSLMTSYRNTFNTDIERNGIDGLIQKLKTMS